MAGRIKTQSKYTLQKYRSFLTCTASLTGTKKKTQKNSKQMLFGMPFIERQSKHKLSVCKTNAKLGDLTFTEYYLWYHCVGGVVVNVSSFNIFSISGSKQRKTNCRVCQIFFFALKWPLRDSRKLFIHNKLELLNCQPDCLQQNLQMFYCLASLKSANKIGLHSAVSEILYSLSIGLFT